MKRVLIVRRGTAAASRLERFEVEYDERTTLLDALEFIRTRGERTLAYRHSCHHGSCGTCAVRVDGKEVLACLVPLASIKSAEPVLEPLAAFELVADLAIDPAAMFRSLPDKTAHLRTSEVKEKAVLPAGIERFSRFEDCIECGCCVSICPVTSGAAKPPFQGPAALAALERENANRPERRDELLDRAAQPDGVAACERKFDCSRICPRGVAPGRKIEQLRKELKERAVEYLELLPE